LSNTSRVLIILALLGALLLPSMRADAQQEGVLVISAPDVASFPNVSFTMDAYDGKGAFLSGLKASDIQILEDGKTIQPAQVEKVSNGLQVILAINLGPSLAHVSDGVSDYQRIQSSLADWANAQPADTLDDYSLSTPTGLFLIRSRVPHELASAVTDFLPEVERAQPSLTSLAQALDLATDPLDRPLIKRSILYITPALPAAQAATLPDLAQRAQQTGVRVNVWEMGQAANGAASAAANPLQQLAEATGGQFASIPSGSPLPNVENVFSEYRHIYQVHYNSAIRAGAGHTLSVAVQNNRLDLSSNESSFSLAVQPPNPIFLSPPESIQRSWSADAANPTPALAPDTVEIKILIEFPDQHQRDLEATRLYVDGKLVDENTSAPFDRFQWDISGLETNTRPVLRLEAVDVLGLSGSSMDTPVEVAVEQPPVQANVIQRLDKRGIAAIGAVGVAGTALILVLVLAGTSRGPRKNRRAEKERMKDPVTQPVPIRQDTRRPQKEKTAPPKRIPDPARSSAQHASAAHTSASRASASHASAARSASASWSVWPLHSAPSDAPARLVALDENAQPVTGGTLLLSRQEITFGSDPRRATQVLESDTIDGLHARLYRGQGDSFYLADQGSVAGTWVNYSPVSKEGVALEHGDVIHIGRIQYRFERLIPDGAAPAQIKVTQLGSGPGGGPGEDPGEDQ
jgi:hypothetical protein